MGHGKACQARETSRYVTHPSIFSHPAEVRRGIDIPIYGIIPLFCSCAHCVSSFLYLTDAHGHRHGGHAAHGPEGDLIGADQKQRDEMSTSDIESVGLDAAAATTTHRHDHDEHHHNGNAFTDKAITQIIGVAILEFGVALHR